MSTQLLTVRDVSEVLQCSEDAVIRRFAKMDGVIDLGKTTLGVRRYRVLRIPKTVVERYLTSKLPKSDRSGRSVSIEVPETSRAQAEVSAVGRPGDPESREGGLAEWCQSRQ
jgi:hypothetical protein